VTEPVESGFSWHGGKRVAVNRHGHSSLIDTGICPWPVEAVSLKQFPDKRIASWLSTFKKKLKSLLTTSKLLVTLVRQKCKLHC
jgi:hypothetical protein